MSVALDEVTEHWNVSIMLRWKDSGSEFWKVPLLQR